MSEQITTVQQAMDAIYPSSVRVSEATYVRVEGVLRSLVAAAVHPYADALARMKPEWQVLREAADLADREGHLWSGAPAHAFFRLADGYRADADRMEAEAKA